MVKKSSVNGKKKQRVRLQTQTKSEPFD